ncbi:MAG: ABC transporter ATP-binding protein [Ndongobacter sp.]|nr:ABC transporter ATP-binding protein [Ndongobacter sp.]
MRRSAFSIAMRLLALVKPLQKFMALAIVAGLFGHLCATFISILAAQGLFSLFDAAPFSAPSALLLIAALGLLRGAFRYAEQTLNHYIAFRLLAIIRDKLFGALRRLAPAKLEGRDKGDLISLITSDVELLEVFYAHTISPAAIAAAFTLIMVLYVGRFHWVLGLWALLAYMLVGVLVPMAAGKRSERDARASRKQSAELSAFVLESLRGLGESIQYGSGAARLQSMNRRTEELSRTEWKLKRKMAGNAAATQTLIFLLDAGMLLLSVLLYQGGQIPAEGVVISTIALMSSFGPAVALANLGSTLQSTFAAGERVLNLLDEEPLIGEIEGKEPVAFQGASVEHLFFAYEQETVLQDVTLDIPENEIVGIVGQSGSGKSTLLRLLMRFWRGQSGEILISNRNLEQINTSNLRDMESFVTQETYLFRDTVANNLRVAKPDATQEELEAACRKASVHELIASLPQGYETPIGELGETLSGGERQRLGLARAFLHGAPLMLLDEPTSNLDSLNEAVILKALLEERQGKTVVLVSHRPSTLRIADTVYSVGQDGRTERRTS